MKGYTLGPKTHNERFPGDHLAVDAWEVFRGGVLVARVFSSNAYPGRFTVSVNPIRWAGRTPDAKGMEAFKYYDSGPIDTLTQAFAWAQRQCEHFVEFRKRDRKAWRYCGFNIQPYRGAGGRWWWRVYWAIDSSTGYGTKALARAGIDRHLTTP